MAVEGFKNTMELALPRNSNREAYCEARFAGGAPGLPLFVVVLVLLLLVVYILGSCAALSASLHPVPLPISLILLPLRCLARTVLQRGP
jgi:hypothetical protein